MITSLASNTDLKSSMDDECGLIKVRIPSSVPDASIVVVGSVVLCKTLAGVATVAGTSATPSGRVLDWPSCSRACFWSRNAFRAFLGPGVVFTLWGRVPSESLLSSDYSILSSSSSLPIGPLNLCGGT
jgi:hypothetical protein